MKERCNATPNERVMNQFSYIEGLLTSELESEVRGV